MARIVDNNRYVDIQGYISYSLAKRLKEIGYEQLTCDNCIYVNEYKNYCKYMFIHNVNIIDWCYCPTYLKLLTWTTEHNLIVLLDITYTGEWYYKIYDTKEQSVVQTTEVSSPEYKHMNDALEAGFNKVIDIIIKNNG